MSSPEDRIDLALKRLDKWVKRIGIVGAILGLALTCMQIWSLSRQSGLQQAQQELVNYQAKAELEKQRVNVTMDLKTFSGPANGTVYMTVTLTNHSARQVSMAMVGIRIWNHEWRNDIQDDPKFLLFSDNAVANCPADICTSQSNSGKTKLWNSPQIVLAGGEIQENTYGPYSISASDLSSGMWIEGRAYTEDQDQGRCLIAGPPQLEGTFPAICEETRLKQRDCYEEARCKYASTPAVFYRAKVGQRSNAL